MEQENNTKTSMCNDDEFFERMLKKFTLENYKSKKMLYTHGKLFTCFQIIKTLLDNY